MEANRRRIFIGLTAGAALAAGGIAPAMARSASQMSDLVGSKASSGESQLEGRGFTFITGSSGYDSKTSYWWHSGDKNCLQVETRDGRFAHIRDGSKGDCNQKGGDNTGAVVAGVAAVAVIGALLAHKSHDHDDNKHYSDGAAEQQYERGYNDGLHGATYQNYARNDSYSSGYSAGVEQRSSNLSYRQYQPDRGGYHPSVDISDLNGARAAGADGEMTRRGFKNVDGFKSGNTAYTIWSRRETHQCVQMTVADGNVYDIRDIGTHPKCR